MMSTPKLPHSTSADRSTKYMICMAGSRSEVYRYMRYMYRSKLQVKPVNGTSTGWLRTSESWRFRPNRHDERRKGTRS